MCALAFIVYHRQPADVVLDEWGLRSASFSRITVRVSVFDPIPMGKASHIGLSGSMQLNNNQMLSSGDVEIDLENRLFHQSIPKSQPYVHPPRNPGAGAAGLRHSAYRASRLVRDDAGSGGPTGTGEDPVYIAPRCHGASCFQSCAPLSHAAVKLFSALGLAIRVSRRSDRRILRRLVCVAEACRLGAVVARVEGRADCMHISERIRPRWACTLIASADRLLALRSMDPKSSSHRWVWPRK